jgi:hypothetical protein
MAHGEAAITAAADHNWVACICWFAHTRCTTTKVHVRSFCDCPPQLQCDMNADTACSQQLHV